MPSYRDSFVDETAKESRSAAARAYRTLRSEILDCTLAPGSLVVEGDIAERLEMSKTPVKKALGMLAHEGFVEIRPRHGYRVTHVTLSDVQEIYQLRQVLEPAAAEQAASNARPEQLQQLRELAEDNDGDSNADRLHKLLRFHEVLAEASGNSRLAATLTNLLDETRRLLSMGLIDDNVGLHAGEHRHLVDALLKGNHHMAREIAEQQVETGRMRMFEAILASLTEAGGMADTVILQARPAAPDGGTHT